MAKGKSAGVVPNQHLKKNFYTGKDSHVAHEAEDMKDGFKRGGKAKKDEEKREARKHGGHVMHVHHEKPEHLKHAKHVGKVHGEGSSMNAGKKARKSGGGVFSSAHSGSPRKPSSHY